MLTGRRATFDAVVRHLLSGDYDVVHVSGQAHFDDQEAFIALHGTALLRASEMRSLLSRRPPVLVLNCPHSAFIPPSARAPSAPVPGGGALGFMEVAATAGVGAFVGCFGEQTDKMAAAVAVGLHEELLAGTPAALALYRARRRTRSAEMRRAFGLGPRGSDPTALMYALSGYPELVLRQPT